MFHKIIDFFSNIPKETWQDIVLTSVFIPIIIFLGSKLKTWVLSILPVNLLLTGYREAEQEVLIYLSQLSAVNAAGNIVANQLYISRFPNPLPANQNNLAVQGFQNIDPVWSEADGRCAANVFNILGRIGKTKAFRIANTIPDWNRNDRPIFTVGFNPRTRALIPICQPMHFTLDPTGTVISIQDHAIQLNAISPNDAGVVQKTFLNNSKNPVIMLAGLGTTGTQAAGNVLNENCVALGKLFGNQPFCVLFQANVQQGASSYDIRAIFPKPHWSKCLFYPATYIKWYRRKIFPG